MSRHVVQEGEKLSGIAGMYGIGVRDVLMANPHKARVQLASGEQVFQSLAAGDELDLPGTVGAWYSSPKAAVNAATDQVKKLGGGSAAGTTFTADDPATSGCAEGYHYDPKTQTCVKNPPKIGLSAEARLRKVQEANARAVAAAAEKQQMEARLRAAEAKSASNKKKLLIAGGAVVVVLGVGGAILALKK